MSNKNDMLDLCFNLDPKNLRGLFRDAYAVSRRNFGNTIHFYAPSMAHYDTSFYSSSVDRFPAISVTGRICQLKCAHCNGELLSNMIPATNPKELFNSCVKIKRSGAVGCLISGGSLHDGRVPLKQFIPTIKQIKKELGLQVVVHTGLVDLTLAECLADAGIDAAMIDILGSNDTIKEVYHLNDTVEAFDNSLTYLEDNNIPIVPHILVGIHFGKLKGEIHAIKLVSHHHPAAIVVIVLMPLVHTQMENTKPPAPIEVARVMLALRLLNPKTPMLLGCARPQGEHKTETDILAIKAGVNGIAYSSEEGYQFAKAQHLNAKMHEQCCSLIWHNMLKENPIRKR